MFNLRFNTTKRFLAVLIILFIASLALPACGDSNSNGNGNGSDENTPGFTDNDIKYEGELKLTHGSDKITADDKITLNDASVKSGHLKATYIAGWANPASTPKSGLITAKFEMTGVQVGSGAHQKFDYELTQSIDDTTTATMYAKIVIEDTTLPGLPKTLVSKSGMLKLSELGTANGKVVMFNVSFDGTFVNAGDSSDTKDYVLSGEIESDIIDDDF